jgi:hypothetical protein
MEKYEGADNLVAEMSFSEELVDANNPKAGMKFLMMNIQHLVAKSLRLKKVQTESI